MYNNKLISEAYRMIELSGESPKNIKLLKEKLERKINKKIIKETYEDDDFLSNLIGGIDDEATGKLTYDPTKAKEREGEKEIGPELEAEVERLKGEQNQYDAKDDISNSLKIALLTDSERGIDINVAKALGFNEDDFITIEDLSTKSQTAGMEVAGETVYISKRGKNLYSFKNIDDFNKLTQKGKVFIKSHDNAFYGWLENRNLNSIGISESNGKISKDGNATLNFLGRVMSGYNLRPGESELISAVGKLSSQDAAYKILQKSYRVFADNHILNLINASNRDEFGFEIEEAVSDALINLAQGKWNGKDNLSPWFLEVVKNNLKDYQKSITRKPGVTGSAALEFFEKMLKDDGVITIVSSKKPSHSNLASKVEKDGKKWRYLYNDINDAMMDLQDSNTVPAHHMKKEYVGKEYAPLYGSSRDYKAFNQSSLSGVDLENIPADNEVFDKSSEDEIKAILGDAVEFMSDSTTRSGLSRATSTELNPGNPVVKKAKDNIINFIYNFFMGAQGDSIVKTVKDTNPDSDTYGKNISVYDSKSSSQPKKGLEKVSDIEDSGKLNKEVIVNWIESQNKKMTRELVDEREKYLNKKLNKDEIKNLITQAENDKLLMDPNKDLQKLRNAFIEYLKKDGNKAFNKIRDLIGSAPPEGLAEAVKTLKKLIGYSSTVNDKQNANLTLEQKIRAKIKKILRESFTINENDEDEEYDFGNLGNQINTLSNIYKEKFDTIDDLQVNKINSYIKDIISGKKPNGEITYKNSADKFKFTIHIMAILYNGLDEAQKINVINYITKEIYGDGGKKFVYNIKNTRQGGALSNSKNIDDIIQNVMKMPDAKGYLPVEKALINFDITKARNTKFFGWLLGAVAGGLSNLSKKDDPGYSKGKPYVHTDSMDLPVNDSDDSGAKLSDTIESPSNEDNSTYDGNFWNVMGEYLSEKGFLSKTQLEFFQIMNDPEVQDDEGNFSPSLASNLLDITPGNARIQNMRVRAAIREAGKERGFVDYIKQRTDTDLRRMVSEESINLLRKLLS